MKRFITYFNSEKLERERCVCYVFVCVRGASFKASKACNWHLSKASKSHYYPLKERQQGSEIGNFWKESETPTFFFRPNKYRLDFFPTKFEKLETKTGEEIKLITFLNHTRHTKCKISFWTKLFWERENNHKVSSNIKFRQLNEFN